MMRKLGLELIVFAVLLSACKTPEGPRLPLPPQDLAINVPDGYARVVFFNDSTEALYPSSGNIRIQLDGKTAPSLYLNHYSQLFLSPGRYELLLEHWDVFTFTDEYEIEIREPDTFIRIWCSPISTKHEIVESLPADFDQRFIGGRDLTKWPPFVP